MSFFIIAVDNFNEKLTILYATVFLKMGSVTAIGYENNDKKWSTKVTISSLKYNFIHIMSSGYKKSQLVQYASKAFLVEL